jgi:hypothetical protein
MFVSHSNFVCSVRIWRLMEAEKKAPVGRGAPDLERGKKKTERFIVMLA